MKIKSKTRHLSFDITETCNGICIKKCVYSPGIFRDILIDKFDTILTGGFDGGNTNLTELFQVIQEYISFHELDL